jgi:hypothetical protein
MTKTTIGRVTAVTALGLMALTYVGCTNSPPRRAVVEEPRGTLVQQSSVAMNPGEEKWVFYPRPYTAKPGLEVHSVGNNCQVLEERADGFRVRNVASASPGSFTWKASGQPAGVVVTTTNPPPPPGAVVRVGVEVPPQPTPYPNR